MQLKKLKIDKAGMLRRLRFAALPALCMTMLLTACGKGQNDSLVLFEEDTYNYRLVYSLQREEWEDTAVVKLYEGLEDLCGVAPELVADTVADESDDVCEILIGSTNREVSNMPDLGETDCYWGVIVNKDQIVINGSNEYMIGLAVDYIMSHWTEAA